MVAGYGSDDEAVAQEGSQVDAQQEPEVQELQFPRVCKCQEEEFSDGAAVGHLVPLGLGCCPRRKRHGHVRACFSEENLFCFSEKPPTLPLSFSRGPSCCSLPSVLICSGSVCHEAQAPQPTGSPGVRPALQQLVNRSGKSPIYRGSHCKWTPRAECRSLDAVTLGNSVHVLQGEMTLALGPPASGKVPWDGFTFWGFFYHLNRDDWV